MKLLIVSLTGARHPLAEALVASPLWRVQCCMGLAEAAEALAREAFDYVLVDTEDSRDLEAARRIGACRRNGEARVVDMPRRAAEFPVGDGSARFGCRTTEDDNDQRGDGAWVFEFHAPCRATGCH